MSRQNGVMMELLCTEIQAVALGIGTLTMLIYQINKRNDLVFRKSAILLAPLSDMVLSM
jgi:hypothetical protein